MKMIEIQRNSSLFRFIAFLQKFPIFNIFIQREYQYFNNETNKTIYDYNTFNDICTFCRHMIYIILTTLLYLLVGAIMFDHIIIQSILFLFYGGSIIGAMTVSFVGIMSALYLLVLITQHIHDRLEDKSVLNPDYEEPSKEAGFFHKTFELISQKHNNLCKRLKVKD